MPTRNYRQLDDLPPSWLAEYPSATTNQYTAPHPSPAEADSSTFSPTPDILTANQAFSPHSAHRKNPSQALKTPRRHTAQQPHKDTPYPSWTSSHKHLNTTLHSLNSWPNTTFSYNQKSRVKCTWALIWQEKGAIKWNHHPKPHKSPHPHHFTKHKNNNFTMMS